MSHPPTSTFGNTPMLSALSHPGGLQSTLPTTPYVSALQAHKDTAAPRHVISIKQFDRSRLHQYVLFPLLAGNVRLKTVYLFDVVH